MTTHTRVPSVETKSSEKVTESLNVLLADWQMHYQKLRNFHWNVYGENFFELHEKFEELYDEARVRIDAIAERILTLGHAPMSNYSEYISTSSIEEQTGKPTPNKMVAETLKDFDILIRQMNKTIEVARNEGDDGTEDMITGYLRELEKWHWMMYAFLRDNPLD